MTRQPSTFMKRAFLFGLAAWIIAVFVTWIAATRTAPFTGDDGYYLYNAALVHHDELVPIRDFRSHYSPGYTYLISMVWTLTNDSHTGLLAFILLLATTSCLALATSLKTLAERLLLVAFLLPAMLLYEGGQPYLEPFFVPLLVLAHVILKDRGSLRTVTVAGLLCGGAVMIKQMAVLTLPAFLLSVWLPGREGRAVRIGCFGLGLAVPFLVFCWAAGLDPVSTAHYLADYAHDKYGAGPTDASYLATFFLKFPAVSVPAAVAFIWALFNPRRHAFEITAISLNLVPLLFQPFYHYYLPILPWCAVLFVRMMAHFERRLDLAERLTWKPATVVIAAVVLATLPVSGKYVERIRTSGNPFNTFYGGLNPDSRVFQDEKGRVIADWSSSFGPLHIFGDAALQFVSGIRLPDHSATSGFIEFHHNRNHFEKLAAAGAPAVIVERPGKEHVTDPIQSCFSHSGYTLIHEVRVREDILKLMARD